MSLEINGQVCPICKAYIFEEDEVAVCPTCGAPHHRECFVKAGRCGMEEFHGTENQYDKQKEKEKQEEKTKQEPNKTEPPMVNCPSCLTSYPADKMVCPSCGAPRSHGSPFFMKFDFLGGVSPDEDLGEGHKADEVKDFVAVSTNRFIPKFKEFKGGKKVWFSFWHLLFPSASFAMRKMYVFAAFSAAFEVAAALFMLPFGMVIESLSRTEGINNYYQLIDYISENMNNDFKNNLILAGIGLAIFVILRVLAALFANKLYYRHTIKTMTEIKAKTEDTNERKLLYRKHGGLNLLSFILFYMVISWLPTIIFSVI